MREEFASYSFLAVTAVLLPVGCDHDLHGKHQARQSALRRISLESAKWFKETAPARGLGELRPPFRGVPWGERHACDVGLAICHRH